MRLADSVGGGRPRATAGYARDGPRITGFYRQITFYGDLQIFQQTVMQAIVPAVNGDVLAAQPGVLQDRGLLHI